VGALCFVAFFGGCFCYSRYIEGYAVRLVRTGWSTDRVTEVLGPPRFRYDASDVAADIGAGVQGWPDYPVSNEVWVYMPDRWVPIPVLREWPKPWLIVYIDPEGAVEHVEVAGVE
jgi:hypothetical protein